MVTLENANKVKVKMFTTRLLYGLPTFRRKNNNNRQCHCKYTLHYTSDSSLARSGTEMAQTNYINSLSSSDCTDYLKKLVLSNGEKLPDPYNIPSDEWISDMSKWPAVIWPDIYSYLIEKPSVYTNDNLRAYKSLDAYNYELCGHVQNLKVLLLGFRVLRFEGRCPAQPETGTKDKTL